LQLDHFEELKEDGTGRMNFRIRGFKIERLVIVVQRVSYLGHFAVL